MLSLLRMGMRAMPERYHRYHASTVQYWPAAPNPETEQVLLLGTGISDYLDIITAPGYEPHVVSALFDYLDSNRDFWDLCDFQQLRSSSWLLSGTVPDCVSDVQAQESCPMLELAVARGRIKHAIPAKMVSRLSYYRRKLTKIPSAKIETVSRASFDQVFNAF